MSSFRAFALVLACSAPVLASPGTTWRPPPAAPGQFDHSIREVRVLPVGDGVLAVELSFGSGVPDGVFAPAVFWRPAGSSERYTAVGMLKRGVDRVALVRTQTGSMDYYVETYVLSSVPKDRLKARRAGSADKPLHYPAPDAKPADLPSGNVTLPVFATPGKDDSGKGPRWVQLGSGAFMNEDKPAFYGVGMSNETALHLVALGRAVNELALTLDKANQAGDAKVEVKMGDSIVRDVSTAVDRKFGRLALTSLLKANMGETTQDARQEIKLQLGDQSSGLILTDLMKSTSEPAREEQALSLTTLDTTTDDLLAELQKAGVELQDFFEDSNGNTFVLVRYALPAKK